MVLIVQSGKSITRKLPSSIHIKKKESAYNVLTMMLSNGFWCYVGKPIPAGSTNDLGLANTEYPEIKKIMDPHGRDLIIVI